MCKLLGHRFCRYDYDKNTRDRIDQFCHAVSPYSSSTELITTVLGKPNEWGGTVMIPWNLLVHYANGLAGNGFCKRCGTEDPNAESGTEYLQNLKKILAKQTP